MGRISSNRFGFPCLEGDSQQSGSTLLLGQLSIVGLVGQGLGRNRIERLITRKGTNWEDS